MARRFGEPSLAPGRSGTARREPRGIRWSAWAALVAAAVLALHALATGSFGDGGLAFRPIPKRQHWREEYDMDKLLAKAPEEQKLLYQRPIHTLKATPRWRRAKPKQGLIKFLQDDDCPAEVVKWAAHWMWKRRYLTSNFEYTLCMRALNKAGDSEEALNMFEIMRARGLEIGTPAFTNAIIASNKVGDHDKATKLLSEMFLYNRCPLRIGCEHAMQSMEQTGDHKLGKELIDTMWDHGIRPDENTYLPLINTYENVGMFEESQDLFKLMRHEMQLARQAKEAEAEDEYNRNRPKPPQAAITPWRIPGRHDADWAHLSPKMRIEREIRKKMKEEEKEIAATRLFGKRQQQNAIREGRAVRRSDHRLGSSPTRTFSKRKQLYK